MTTGRRALTAAEVEAARNLKRLWEEKKRPLKLTQEKAAALMGITQGAVWQYLNARIPLGTDALLKWSGVLDVQPTEINPSFRVPIGEARQQAADRAFAVTTLPAVDHLPTRRERAAGEAMAADVVTVPVMNAAGSMGGGIVAPEHDAVVGHIPLARDWIRRNLTVSRPAALAVLTAYGDSMSPTFNNGDVLLVDTGIADLKLDAVYVLDREGELFVKRVQRRPDGAFVIKSDNPLYESFTMEAGALARLRVLGRVVWAWNGKSL